MRSLFTTIIGLTLLAASGAAQAKISILVDKDAQVMTVSVDGVERYTWPVSSGNPSHETPNGKFQTFRMEEDHYSKEFDDAPMPHAIFFTKQGHAIHGTDSVNRLGTPASHGCVRLSRANASTLWDLVKSDGLLTTTVTLTGSSQVAIARNPNPRIKPATAVARRDIVPATPSYDAGGNPVDLTQPLIPSRRAQRQVQPQQVDDGYIYPADGASSDQRYPAPPGYRRTYETQAAPQQYYDGRGYVRQQVQPQPYQPQVYVPRPYY